MSSDASAYQRLTDLVRLRRFGDAERLARQLLLSGPEDSTAWCALSVSLAGQGRHDEAHSAAVAAARIAPEDVEARVTLVDALMGLGVVEPAIDEARRLLELAPDSTLARYTAANAMSRGNWTLIEAQELIDRVLQADPMDGDAHNLRGVILWARKWYFEAEEEFRRALEINPTDTLAQSNLAGLAADQFQFRRSGEHLTRALRLDPAAAAFRQRLDVLTRRVLVQAVAWLAVGSLALSVLQMVIPYPARVVAATAGLVILGTRGIIVIRGLPPRPWRWVPDIVRQWPRGFLILPVAATVLFLLYVALGYIPSTPSWSPVPILSRATGVIVVLLVVRTVVRRRGRRHRDQTNG